MVSPATAPRPTPHDVSLVVGQTAASMVNAPAELATCKPIEPCRNGVFREVGTPKVRPPVQEQAPKGAAGPAASRTPGQLRPEHMNARATPIAATVMVAIAVAPAEVML
jgi:hypothetical protein